MAGGFLRLALVALATTSPLLVCAQEEDKEKAAAAPAAAATPSKLAPPVTYLEMWAFLHGKDPDLPKVVYMPKPPEEDDEKKAASEPPSWLTSAAMAFKDGRKFTAKFSVVAPSDAAKVAKRFGIEAETLPALIGCHGGKAKTLPRSELMAGGSATVKAVKAFAGDLKSMGPSEEDGEAAEDDGTMALPSFPEPTRPRKQASASLEEFTHESLPLNCYRSAGRPLCVFAVLDQPSGQGCPDVVGDLARKFRNDKAVAFGCVGAARQGAFLGGLELSGADLPALVAVKGGSGKRPRLARMAGKVGDELKPLVGFVDDLLGGGASFSRLKDGLPELEAPYLLDDEDVPKDEM